MISCRRREREEVVVVVNNIEEVGEEEQNAFQDKMSKKGNREKAN